MHLFKTLSTCAIAFATLFSTAVNASPVPLTEQLSKRSSAGWNDWNCVPSSAHPRALVLVHGLTANGFDNWFYMAPRFVAKGYCVFALSYGQLNMVPIIYGLDKMENSAQQLSDFINKILASTGTTQVDIFGHSEGSLMPRYYMKFLGGAAKVNKFATIGSIQYGTTLLGIQTLVQPYPAIYNSITGAVSEICLSCTQLLQNSTFLQNLNAGGDTVPGVKYLMIMSKYDELVTPYTSGKLRDNNPNVKNQVLQDWCITDTSEHLLQATDPIVFNAVHAFLTPSADQTINCLDALQ